MSEYGEQNDTGCGEQQRMQVVLVYEDFSTGLRARRVFGEVVNQCPFGIDVDLELWRIELLHEPALFERAVNESAKADIVFLSAHGQDELPAAVKLWLQHWLARKGDKPGALAVSLDPGVRSSAAEARTLEFLQVVARPAGVEVFLHYCQAHPLEPEFSLERTRPRAGRRTSVPEELLPRFADHPFRDWGINE